MNKENLYFIALVPDIQLREDIEEIKKEVCEMSQTSPTKS